MGEVVVVASINKIPSRTGPTVLSCVVQKINPKPTDFQPSYRKADGWFCENQPRSNLCIS